MFARCFLPFKHNLMRVCALSMFFFLDFISRLYFIRTILSASSCNVVERKKKSEVGEELFLLEIFHQSSERNLSSWRRVADPPAFQAYTIECFFF